MRSVLRGQGAEAGGVSPTEAQLFGERERRMAAQSQVASELRLSASMDDELQRTQRKIAQFEAAAALPDGWIAQVDNRADSATFSRTFYVDTRTGQSQWDPPPMAPAIASTARTVRVPPGMSGGMRFMVPREDGGSHLTQEHHTSFDWFEIPQGKVSGDTFTAKPIDMRQQVHQQLESQQPLGPAAVRGSGGHPVDSSADAVLAADFNAEDALRSARVAFDARQFVRASEVAEEALTMYESTGVEGDTLMQRPLVQELVSVLEQAEAEQAALEVEEPHTRAEMEAQAAGFSPSQIGRAQAQAVADGHGLLTEVGQLIEACLALGATPRGRTGPAADAPTAAPSHHTQLKEGSDDASTSTCPAAARWGLGDVIHAGYLQKNRPKGLRLMWQRRFFVLGTDGFLRYYDDSEV